MTQKELITRIDERVVELHRQFDNHLKSHFYYSLAAWTTAIGALASLLGVLLIK